MTRNLLKLLAYCLLICLLLAPARAEEPSPPEDRYAMELSLLNRYLQNGEVSNGLDIHLIYDTFVQNGNIGEHATGFRGYAETLALTEEGDFAGALAVVKNLQSSDPYEAFRVYLEDGEDLRARGLYAIRPLDELETYVLARECEALGQYGQAVTYYDQCQTFFDAYDRRSYAASVAPSLSPTKMSAEPENGEIVVPFGETQEISVEINSDGTLYRDGDTQATETLNFSVRVLRYLTPEYYQVNYGTAYALKGNEAGVEFKLLLNDYTGNAEIAPSDLLNTALETVDGTMIQGYALMATEIGISKLTVKTNVPVNGYKRFDYSEDVGDIAYLTITVANSNGSLVKYMFEVGDPIRPTPSPQPMPEQIGWPSVSISPSDIVNNIHYINKEAESVTVYWNAEGAVDHYILEMYDDAWQMLAFQEFSSSSVTLPVGTLSPDEIYTLRLTAVPTHGTAQDGKYTDIHFALAKDTFKALSFTGILAHPTQRLSFRTGPNTCYADMFTLPQSTIVEVISMETGNDVIWVLCRFEYNGYMQYAYTGIKRFDISSDILPWSDFQHRAACAESDINVYSAPYGEGTLRGKVDMNEIVDVLGTMDNFAYIEFYDSSSSTPSRGWVICDDLSDLGIPARSVLDAEDVYSTASLEAERIGSVKKYEIVGFSDENSTYAEILFYDTASNNISSGYIPALKIGLID